MKGVSMQTPNITLPHGRLRELGTRILAAAGATDVDARIVADHMVDSNLSGHDSHGIGLVPFYVRSIRSGSLRPRAHAVIEDRGGALLSVDGGRGFGQIVAREAVLGAMERAWTTGVAVVAVRNTSHIGRVGTYGELAAAQGFVSVHFVNVVGHPPLVAPFRGSDARFSTNPFCVAIPVEGKPPILLDIATSVVALGKTRVAMNRGKPLSDGALIDSRGQPTTDPAVLWREPRGALLPFGLHKGYGLALVCELLAGAVTGGGTEATFPHEPDCIANNMLSFVFDPRRLPGAGRLDQEILTYVAHVKASPPADPSLAVLVAGEPELAERARRSAQGIEVEGAAWEELKTTAAALGVPFD